MANMVKYRVLRDCHWNFGYWDKDRVVEFPEGRDHEGRELPVPPEIHFQRLSKDGKDEVRVNAAPQKEGLALSELAKADQEIPNTGMAHKPGKASKKLA